MVKGREEKLHEKWLRSFGLFSVAEIERRPHCSYKFLMRGGGGGGGAGTDFFSVVTELKGLA